MLLSYPLQAQGFKQSDSFGYTMNPVLSGHRIMRTVAEVPKFISLIYFKSGAPNEDIVQNHLT